MRRVALLLAVLLATLPFYRWATARPTESVVASSFATAPGADGGYKLPLDIRHQGTATCSSTDCHHKNGPQGTQGSEYTAYMNYDPHQKAYSVLFEERSILMLKLYRNLKSDEPSLPHQDALCLKCHAMTGSSIPTMGEAHRLLPRGGLDEDKLVALREDAVSCESCHGPAGRYRTTHYQASFKGLSLKDKAEQFGLWPTKDVAFRAWMCGQCHIGWDEGGKDPSSLMEVNHDLIAAGHPRLNFNFAGYHSAYPKHWQQRESGADYETKLWLIGEVSTALAAIDLLRARAERAIKTKDSDYPQPWPELSEYSCYSCHQSIQANGARRTVTSNISGMGKFWGTWYFDPLQELLKVDGLKLPGQPKANFADRLTHVMKSPTFPSAEAASQAAREVVSDLKAWLTQLSRSDTVFSVDTTRKILQASLKVEESANFSDWDQAMQKYQTIAAAYFCISMNDRSLRAKDKVTALRGLLAPLKFKRSSDKARQFYDGPENFQPSEFKKRLQTLAEKLTSKQ